MITFVAATGSLCSTAVAKRVLAKMSSEIVSLAMTHPLVWRKILASVAFFTLPGNAFALA